MHDNFCDLTRGWAPVLPFWGWTAYTPVIPKLYYDCISAEQSVKNLWKCFDKMTHYADYLADNINKYSPVELEERLTIAEQEIEEIDRYVKYDNAIVEIFHDNRTVVGSYSTWEYLGETIFKNWEYQTHNGGIMGWSRPDNNNRYSLSFLQEIAQSQTQEYRDTVTLVIFQFGYWDIYGTNEFVTTDFETLGRTLVNTARNYYNNADIYIYPLTTKCYGISRPRMLNFYSLIYGATRSQVPIYFTQLEDAFSINICQPIHFEDDLETFNGGGTNSIGAQIKCGLYGNNFKRSTRLNLPSTGYANTYQMELWLNGWIINCTSGSMNVITAVDNSTVIGHVPAILTPPIKMPCWTIINDSTKEIAGFIYIDTYGNVTFENGNNSLSTGTYRCIGSQFDGAFTQNT